MSREPRHESEAELSRRLVIASNRLPFNVTVEKGELVFSDSSGGLVTGLAAYLEERRRTASSPHLWVGWPGGTVAPPLREALKEKAQSSFLSYPVFLSKQEMEQFYLGFCNATIWPLFHYFPTYAVYDSLYWDQYRHVNEVFCQTLLEVLSEEDVVWVHDYHLMLLPRLLKAKLPRLSVGFFLHTPFPSFEVFRLLPGAWRREILEGLLGADLVGFHTYEYTHHFLQSVLRILGYEHQLGQIMTSERAIKVGTFPMGIDFEKFSTALSHPEVRKEQEELKSSLSQWKVILSVDRLDYSKGILNRLEGYEIFLESYPEYHGKVVLLMIVVPSRIGVYRYDRMKRQIEELVGKINGRFGRIDWTPVVYRYRQVPFHSLVALYSVSDIALLTPLRDGMNLVAKEYIASQREGNGMLILSEMAGAAKELAEAIIINPNNRSEIAEALREALETPLAEQQRRNQAMQRRLQRYNVNRWANDFVKELIAVREVQNRVQAKLLSPSLSRDLANRYRSSSRRSLLLDYDGTLVPLVRHHALARPDEKRRELLRALGSDPKNSVVIISGRDRKTLEAWFGDLPVGFIAEHGVWLRKKGEAWQTLKNLTSDWKQGLLPILETYADRLPGAFVEEKEFSLAWHYRLADPEQAGFLVGEIIDHLGNLTGKSDLQVLQGNKVIEIRNAGINKGAAALDWIMHEDFDFVLAIGDDVTDEDLFRVLPESAVSIRVGVAGTHAQHNLRSADEVIQFLTSLAEPAAW
ncbi:MAG TPA: bifunctional alpha,alpha-trehalose-phosphate synthase (UDP-forming)/trehalose-phosphatase [Candidatus Binatia bacterium]|nr:bifunctional alpha,alpha-trehalose-phosphate synthase (UDP-forming)/trehalose-phosphatase [Candidatus Binatia bacterium]